MKKRILALVLSMGLLLHMTLPGTLAVSLDEAGTVSTFTTGLTCTTEEHTHDDTCRAAEPDCGQEETEAHSHTADCHALLCGKTEHQHADGCYTVPETTATETTEKTEAVLLVETQILELMAAYAAYMEKVDEEIETEDDLLSIYDQFLTVWDGYEALSADEQEQVENREFLIQLNDVFSVMNLAATTRVVRIAEKFLSPGNYLYYENNKLVVSEIAPSNNDNYVYVTESPANNYVITIKNFVYSGEGQQAIHPTNSSYNVGFQCAMQPFQNVTIELIGESSFTVENENGGKYIAALHAHNNVAVTIQSTSGDGKISFVAEGSCWGYTVGANVKSLTLKSGTAAFYGGENTRDEGYSAGITAVSHAYNNNEKGSTLTVTGGTLIANGHLQTKCGDSSGIRVETVMINGGTVQAAGGSTADNTSDTHGIIAESVTITGGSVTASAGGNAGDSIGINATVGGVTITGGEVVANGGTGKYTDGIWAQGDVIISDATVTATAGAGEEISRGIISQGNITITNSDVTATAGSAGTGTSYGMAAIDSGSKVTIQDSIVIANGGEAGDTSDGILSTDGTDIKGDSLVMDLNPSGGTGTVTGKVTLTEDLTIPPNTDLTIGENASLNVSGGTTLTNNGTISNDGSLNILPNGNYVDNGKRDGDGVLDVDGNMTQNGNEIIENGELADNANLGNDSIHIIVNVYYFDKDGNRNKEPQNAVVLRPSMLIQEDETHYYYLPPGSYGWYYVNGTVNMPYRFYVQDGINSNGDPVATNIILGNNSTLNANHGIDVSVSDEDIKAGKWSNSLNIYQEAPEQDANDNVTETNYTVGILNAHGTSKAEDGSGYNTAGIGGGDWRFRGEGHSGMINIYGGTINVSGAKKCANIGSGEGGMCGPIVIRNAKVTSGNAGQAASIGAGYDGQLATFPPDVINITIDNSIVLATSDRGYNGIGEDSSGETNGTAVISDSVVFTDKMGPVTGVTYKNTLLFLNSDNSGVTEENQYGHYHGDLMYGSDASKTVTLALPLVIPETATLTIEGGETLRFDPNGSGLFNNVRFDNNGKIYRDWESKFDTNGIVPSENVGVQTYEIVEEIDKLEKSNITGEGVETFNDKVYSLPGKKVIVTAAAGTQLEMTVTPADISVTQGDTANIQTFTMPASPVKLNGTVHEHFNLTITTNGTSDADPDHSYIFTIVNAEKGISMTVVLVGNQTKIIRNLPYGTYTVTEQSGWSWRYKQMDSQTATADKNELTFTVEREQVRWLDGYAWYMKED